MFHWRWKGVLIYFKQSSSFILYKILFCGDKEVFLQRTLKFLNRFYKILFFLLFNSFFLFFSICSFFILGEKSFFIEWEIFILNGNRVVISLIFDWIRRSFLIVVSLISGSIIIYSIYYIEGEKRVGRFVIVLFMFVCSIIFLIIRPNLISLLLGWDGLGLTSYVLVIFYQREFSCNSGIITILRNRIGDAAILLTIGWVFYLGSWNFFFFEKSDFVIGVLVILAAITKRAQIPFSAWLPAAIAAPTPVSALVHSSTLVTAGVYLIIRFFFLLREDILFFLLIIGVITILISGWVANFERDIKKVIALSTLSQLGLIFIILGSGNYLLAFFHLFIHALFKSTLFICAGFIIHNLRGRQDGRFAGVFNNNSPVLGIIFGCTNLALCGFPFLRGFYSKDRILEYCWNTRIGLGLVALVVLATGLTLSYRVRVIYLSCLNERKRHRVRLSDDFNSTLLNSTVFLFFIRVVGGFFFSWLFISKRGIYLIRFFEKFYVFSILFFSFLLIFFLIKKIFYIKNNFFFRRNLIIFLPSLTLFPIGFFFLNKGVNHLKIIDKGWYEYRGPIGVIQSFSTGSLYFFNTRLFFLLQIFFSFLLFVLLIFFINC